LPPLFFLMTLPPPISTLFPYTTLFRSLVDRPHEGLIMLGDDDDAALRDGVAPAILLSVVPNLGAARNEDIAIHDHAAQPRVTAEDRKSTRLNSSHVAISYAVFCLKKKK